MRKTADQYRYERDQLKRRVAILETELDKMQHEVRDYTKAMRRMQGHMAVILAQPVSQYREGWLDAIEVFSNEVMNATSEA